MKRILTTLTQYVPQVMYDTAGMTDKNKDTLQRDLLELVQCSRNRFLVGLFPEQIDPNSKKRPTTASFKIKVPPSPQRHSAHCNAESIRGAGRGFDEMPAALHPMHQTQ